MEEVGCSPVGVDSAEQLRLQIHVVEAGRRDRVSTSEPQKRRIERLLVDDLVPVGLDLMAFQIIEFFTRKRSTHQFSCEDRMTDHIRRHGCSVTSTFKSLQICVDKP